MKRALPLLLLLSLAAFAQTSKQPLNNADVNQSLKMQFVGDVATQK